MSRFLHERHAGLAPYVTPKDRDAARIRLDMNEPPFPPSPKAVARAAEAARTLARYPDPDCVALTEETARIIGASSDELMFANGSDEILSFIFMAFCGPDRHAAAPEISYSFYSVLARLNGVEMRTIPLQPDLSLRPADAVSPGAGAIFIPNPNSPTARALSVAEMEEIVRANAGSVVVIDEAYVDFGTQTCLPLVRRWDNALVVRTFSKSRALAGARLGFVVGHPDTVRDLRIIKGSCAPYGVDAMTQAAGLGALEDEAWAQEQCHEACRVRDASAQWLRDAGLDVGPSATNFLLARCPSMDGPALARRLKDRGILVRAFGDAALRPYVRITVGTEDEMHELARAVREILEEVGA
ncbi:MAG: aminotransferase class I/II-fold pyridoxal phosphate-dependent enzyme [Synergistaceae bacterium]|nr:aminotransferase class I/II-fold pyridoxal phosphate-dependent enzyme [Synergistaceae bacterium]